MENAPAGALQLRYKSTGQNAPSNASSYRDEAIHVVLAADPQQTDQASGIHEE